MCTDLAHREGIGPALNVKIGLVGFRVKAKLRLDVSPTRIPRYVLALKKRANHIYLIKFGI